MEGGAGTYSSHTTPFPPVNHTKGRFPDERAEQPARAPGGHGGEREHEDGVDTGDGVQGGAHGVVVLRDEVEGGGGGAGAGQERGEEGVGAAGAPQGEVGVPCQGGGG